MPNVHKYPPVAYRPPLEIRDALNACMEREGRKASAIITDALRAYLAEHEADAEAES